MTTSHSTAAQIGARNDTEACGFQKICTLLRSFAADSIASESGHIICALVYCQPQGHDGNIFRISASSSPRQSRGMNMARSTNRHRIIRPSFARRIQNRHLTSDETLSRLSDSICRGWLLAADVGP
jgi:hypothetical protein